MKFTEYFIENICNPIATGALWPYAAGTSLRFRDEIESQMSDEERYGLKGSVNGALYTAGQIGGNLIALITLVHSINLYEQNDGRMMAASLGTLMLSNISSLAYESIIRGFPSDEDLNNQ